MTTRKENSLLFSLKELKDLTADVPAEAPKPAPSPARRANTVEGADDLLGDIRGLIGSAAEEEAAALEAQRLAERRAAEAALLRTQTAKKAEIEARLAAERARQQAAEEERVARQRAIDIAEGRLAPEPKRPAFEAAQPMAQPMSAQLAAPRGRSAGFYLAVVGLPLISLTAVVIALILKPNPPAPQPLPPIAQAPLPTPLPTPLAKPVRFEMISPDAGAPMAKAASDEQDKKGKIAKKGKRTKKGKIAQKGKRTKKGKIAKKGEDTKKGKNKKLVINGLDGLDGF
ncbi:hypothetical protein KKB55_20435 [Myxococcota bacterium]|nr:hypothetical protein [Myxococcota bacterium]MBU1900117.1 hypothetical protein [Myxococcota bacterium]